MVDVLHLLFILLTSIIISLFSGLGLLPLHATWSASTEWRCESKVDMLLGVESDNERWDVDDLLSNTISRLENVTFPIIRKCDILPDVSLADENSGVMDGLCQSELVDTSLQSALQEILNLQGQDVIELHA
jgi:hypothetical protein